MNAEPPPLPKPTKSRRIAAIASWITIVGAGLVLVLLLVSDPLTMVAAAAALAVAVAAAWNALTRRGAARLVSAATRGRRRHRRASSCCSQPTICLALFASLGLAVAAVGLGRYSLGRDRASLISAPTPGLPVSAATQASADHEPEVGRRKGRTVQAGGRVPRPGHRASGPAAGRRPRAAGRSGDRAGSRRDRDGGRRRVAGLGRVGRRAAWRRARRGARRHAQPLRTRPGSRPRRRRRRARRLRSGGRAAHRPRRGQRPRVRQQRVARRLRGDHAVRGVPRREGGHHAREAADAARAREETPRTSAGRVPMASTTTRPISSRCRTTGTACAWAAAPAPATASTTESSASSPSKSRAPLPQWSSPRSSPCADPMARVPSRTGRHPHSRSPQAGRSRPGLTAKLCSSSHPCCSASSRVRCGCGFRSGRSATPPRPSRDNPRPRRSATCGGWRKVTRRASRRLIEMEHSSLLRSRAS